MNKWNEIRTAYKLAKLGTLSATALDIGVHRSTVMRHIDVLEDHLGIILFQRNDKGYIPTEAGLEIMRLGEVTDSHFSQLPVRLQNKSQELEGTLSITIVTELISLLMPSIKQYQSLHSKMQVNLLGDIRNFNLEYGEADIAIRGGEKPDTPDNVVIPLLSVKIVFCAHKSYIDEFGMPTPETLLKHRFVGLSERPKKLLWNEWIYNNVSKENIVVSGSNQQLIAQALMSGCGIGAAAEITVQDNPDLVEIPVNDQWEFPIWLLVHRDIYSMPKVKAFLAVVKAQERWSITLM